MYCSECDESLDIVAPLSCHNREQHYQPPVTVPARRNYSSSGAWKAGGWDMHTPGSNTGQPWTDSDDLKMDEILGLPPLSMEGLAQAAEVLGRSMEGVRDRYERRHPEYYSNARDDWNV